MEELKDTDLDIRQATCYDYDALTYISRVCFPEQLRWRATKSRNRKWWEYLINSQNCEIWVCSVHGQVVAFVTLVLDRSKYDDSWDEQRFTFVDCLPILMSCPKQFIKKIFVRLKRNRTQNFHNEESTRNDVKTSIYKKIREIIADSKPWCGPIAVLPSMGGRGVSVKMMEQCFLRAKSLGYKEIYSAVQKRNIKSRVVVAIAGFNVINEVNHTLFYKKTL